MIRGKKMKSEAVLNTITGLGKEIPDVEKTLFTALVEDTKKMEERMVALEKKVDTVQRKVDGVEKKVDSMQNSVDRLSELVETAINQKQSFWKLLSELIQEQKFWIWLMIFTVLIFGVSLADLKGLLGG